MTQCIDDFSFSLEKYVRKSDNEKNPAILRFSFSQKKKPFKCNTCIERKQIVTEWNESFLGNTPISRGLCVEKN